MRISDWSSDVCSFDLVDLDVVVPPSPLVVQFEHPRPHLCVLRTGALVEAHACARSSECCSERQKDVVRRSNTCKTGRASGRERLWPYVRLSVVSDSLKKNSKEDNLEK